MRAVDQPGARIEGASMTIMYHEGSRRLQDEFESRRIADRLEEKLTRTIFNDDDKAFIEGAVYFFLASADASYLTGQTIYPDGGRLALNYTVALDDQA